MNSNSCMRIFRRATSSKPVFGGGNSGATALVFIACGTFLDCLLVERDPDMDRDELLEERADDKEGSVVVAGEALSRRSEIGRCVTAFRTIPSSKSDIIILECESFVNGGD